MINIKYLEDQIKEEKQTLKIIKSFNKKGLKDYKRFSVQNSLTKKPLLIFDIDDLKHLKKIVNIIKPTNLYYIDNTTTNDLSKWEKQKITTTDNKVLNGIEWYKTKDKFFKLHFPICLNFNNSGIGNLNITLHYEDLNYEVWVKFDIEIVNKDFLVFEDVLNRYETERARQYNFKHKEILKEICYLKDNDGLIQINFYNGLKKVFSINKEGSKIIKQFLKL